MTEVKEVKEKEELSFCIVNGPPEMDLYFALARGTWVSFKLSFSDTAAERDIYINGIKFEKSYWEYRLQMTIKGAFRGNGIDSWSNFAYERDAQKGEEKKITLILRLIADFGLIGLPNAGKSSSLNKLTNADVKTAAYPFTTLEPNLGVVAGKVLADIPGLIEGASTGRGLGIKFLKHIEKVSLLLHCISVESENIEKDYDTVVAEISKYNKSILSKKTIILLTKTDLVSQDTVKEKIRTLKKLNSTVIPVSIYVQSSLDLIRALLST